MKMAMMMKAIITYTLTSAILIAEIFTTTCTSTTAAVVPRFINVVNLGGIPDGETDSTLQFKYAWASACSSYKPATIYVPAGDFYLQSAFFDGRSCKSEAISFRIDGTLLAPSDYPNNNSSWIKFKNVTGVSIYGGSLDGRGAFLWACKASSTGCPAGSTTLKFYNSRNIVVNGLTSINSQKFHIVINGCQTVNLIGITISAPGNSPNTDGIHIESSSGVTVFNSRIATGDDCVSIGHGSSNIWIESITCGPGHGVSIGSLGRSLHEAGVQNVTVKTALFKSTKNGVRIKTWGKESNGFVKGVVFEDLMMMNVRNPVIIDQNYCPGESNCPQQDAGVRISDVRYEGIHGTSATDVGVKLICSNEHPCKRITMEDVNLSYHNRPAHVACVNALGTTVANGPAIAHHMTFTSCFLKES